jgi:Tfp pilus assembly protein PilF
LGRAGRIDEAQRQLEEALRIDANLGDAHLLLAKLLMAKGQAVAAVPHLQKATGDADAGVRDEAREMLRRLGK